MADRRSQEAYSKKARIQELLLPTTVITRSDVGRLLAEAEKVDEQLQAAAIRAPGESIGLPKTSHVFEEFLGINKLNVLHDTDRRRLQKFLSDLRTKAPILHFGFGTEPDPDFQQKLISWVREQINPLALLQIGLHPSIGAGCILRTTNKYYDFSLRKRFAAERQSLITSLRSGDAAIQPSAAEVNEELDS